MPRLLPYVSGALDLARIQPVPKAIHVVGARGAEQAFLQIHPDTLRIWNRRYQDDLELLLRLIESGQPVPDRFYRASTNFDSLLRSTHRVMHLHLVAPHSDVLVYLVQRANSVILIEVADHRYLRAMPPGGSLPRDLIAAVGRRFPERVGLRRLPDDED